MTVTAAVMGVPGLWDILEDVKTPVGSLKDLSGLTLAVDLAIWICESNNVPTNYGHLEKLYLQNIFYRISAAIKAGIKLVFVLDGDAPALKFAGRIRPKLNQRSSECCKIFEALGVPWIKARGEAEAFCATLNKCGIVDGVVSKDGDCFLYGARKVYRNFSIGKKKTGKKEKEKGETRKKKKEKVVQMECYSMNDIEVQLNYDQHGLIALGLLIGCDYNNKKGVRGVGKEKATKLLSSWKGLDALEIFSSWRSGTCTAAHQPQEKKREERIRDRALKDPNFPDKNIIQEYLKPQRYKDQSGGDSDLAKDKSLKLRIEGEQPKLDKSCCVLMDSLGWKLEKAVKKVLPLVTHVHLTTMQVNQQLQFHSIQEERQKDKTKCFDVKWTLNEPGSATLNISDHELVTTETVDSIKKTYPEAVAKYYEGIEAKKAEKKSQRRSKKMTDYLPAKKPRLNQPGMKSSRM